MSERLYGTPPKDLGLVDLRPTEMMCWLYCPISTPDHEKGYIVPENLRQFETLVRRARLSDPAAFRDGYVYITAKTLFVSGSYSGNRPGWHSDGFGTDDLNFIWCDRAPTEFLVLENAVPLSMDCDVSMLEMDILACMMGAGDKIETYPDKHLLRLDPSVIHRPPVKFDAGMRTFIKVSISKDRYDLAGN